MFGWFWKTIRLYTLQDPARKLDGFETSANLKVSDIIEEFSGIYHSPPTEQRIFTGFSGARILRQILYHVGKP
jgi:hypothetical protein